MWVLSHNSYKEPEYDRLVECLEKLNIDYIIVKTIPFTDKIIPADFDTLSYKGDIDIVPDAEIDDDAPIWVMGSYGLVLRGIKKGWKPGAWIDNLDVTSWANGYGSDHILNPDFRIDRVWDVVIHENKFIRPVSDSKTFAGEVFTPDNWSNFLEFYRYSRWKIDPNEEVIVSSPKKILSEVRFFIIDGKIVGSSVYVKNGKVIYDAKVPEFVTEYAKDRIECWEPNLAYVLDIAVCPGDKGPTCKVLEVNNFNAAGLYAVDVQKIVFAVQERFF